MKNDPAKFKEPLLNIEEPAPLYLAIIIILIHLALTFVSPGAQNFFLGATALLAENGSVLLANRPLGNVSTLLTHTLSHADWMHVLMNAGFIFAFGVLTIRASINRHQLVLGRLQRGALIFIAVFLAGAVLGGLAQWAVWIFTNNSGAAIGASTGGAALFATTGWALGGKQRMLGFMAVMMAVDAFFVISGGMVSGMHNPAWAGHLGGFCAGALLAPKWLKPGGASFSRFR